MRRFFARRAPDRGAIFIEFMMILPLVILLVCFMLETANMMRTSALLNSATQSAVRVAAQRGGTGFTAGAGHKDVTDEFAAVTDALGFKEEHNARVVESKPSLCRRDGEREVVLVTEVRYLPITPLGTLIQMMGSAPPDGTDGGGTITFRSVAVARCEVTW